MSGTFIRTRLKGFLRDNIMFRCYKSESRSKWYINMPFRVVVMLFMGASFLSPLFAANSEDADYRNKLPSFYSHDTTEQVDPNSGSLNVKHVDLFLPGNGGLDISIKRIYNTARLSGGLSSTYMQSYKWAGLGPGWEIRAAPKLYSDNIYTTTSTNISYGYPPLTRLCSNISYLNWVPHNLMIELPDGRDEEFYSAGGNMAVTKSNWKVTCSSNIITVRSPDGILYDFGNISTRKIGKYTTGDVQGYSDPPPLMMGRSVTYMNAVKATDANGNWISYSYQQFGTPEPLWAMPGTGGGPFPDNTDEGNENPSQLLSQITASDGRVVNFTYSSSTGRLQSLNDGAGHVWQYQYLTPDSNNSRTLSKVIRPDGSSWEYVYAPGPFKFASDPSIISPLTNATITARKLVSLKYPTGGVVNYTYDFYNITGALASARGERIQSRTRSTGGTWNYAYTRGGAGQYNTTTITGPDGVETYKFMGTGYATPSSCPTPYQNNAWQVGQLMEHTSPNGAKETYVWQQRLIVSAYTRITQLGCLNDQAVWAADLQSKTVLRDGATYTTTYSNYDAYGNPGTIVETGLNGGNRTTTRTYLNDTTKWIIGRLKDESFAGSATTRTFDANGNLTNVTKDGVSTSYTYDAAGNVATATMPRGLLYSFSNYKRGIPQTENQPEGINITRVVDNAGNITSETNGAGKTTTYTYDGLNRVTSVTTPIGNPKTTVYTATSKTTTRGSLIETTQYAPFGQVASITLGGITTSFSYDALGRRTFESNPGATIGKTYEYDALDRITKITNADNTFQIHAYGAGTKTITDERNNATTYTYRAYGDPDKQYLMGVSAPISAASVTLTRNSKDLVTSATQAGLTRTYGYDSRYYLTSVVNPETGTTTYGRDDAGNMTSLKVGNSGTTTYTYDGRNRLSVVTYPNPSTTPTVTHTYTLTDKPLSISSSAATKGFIYDDNGNLTKETLTVDSIPFVTEYIYNANDQIASMIYPRSGQQINYVPDVLGRPTQVSGYVNAVTYWPSGLIKQINYANGVITNYEQHARLWPSTFTTKKGTLSYSDSAYTYDEVGNLKTITDSADAAFNVALDYDNMNRVVSHTNAMFNSTIAYDGADNILNRIYSGTPSNYNYDAYNRLANISDYLATTYTYDVYGNVASGNGNAYTYDDASNLTCVNCSNATTKIQYGYDGSKNRVSVVKAGVKSYEVYGTQGTQLVEYTPSQSQKLIEYIYLAGKRIAQRETTQ